MAEKIQEEGYDPQLETTIKRNVALYFTGAMVSNLGTFMYNFAIGLYVLSLTGSGQSFAISILFGMVPRIILAPFAGVLADKFDRKKMTVSMDILSGLLLISVYLISNVTTLTLGIIYFSSAMLTVFNTFFGISFGSSVPNMVNKERLIKINSLRTMSDSIASIAGPLLGGLVYSFIGIKYFILINGISFVCSGISEIFINFNIHGHKVNLETKQESFKKTFTEGLTYLKKHQLIMGLLKYILLINFITASIQISLPYTSVEVLGATSTQYGLIQMGFPVGLMVMSILFSMSKQDNTKIFKRTTISMFYFGILLMCLGLPSNPMLSFLPNSYHMILTFIVSFFLGMVIIKINIPIQTMMQLSIDDEYRGRVGGVLSMMAQGIMPIGILLFGFIIDRISSYLLPIISGILILGIATVMIKDKKMLQL